ncbi:hypothetical protein [Nonomuraea sp. NPDC050643]|uniref:fascin domain-containing protein n=1 Tax=Nonomuraea sp. NPDC050643 TaxID=3155660 RepID=UPI00340B817D
MNIKKAAVIAAAVVLTGLGMSGAASAQTAGPIPRAVNGPVTCTLQTFNTGNFVTAVGGGGRTTDVVHTDATQALAWERFTLVDSGDGSSPIRYGIKTVNGRYLTAVGGGNRVTDVIHSDATQLLAWEKFQFVSQGNGVYAIRTIDGHFLTAVGGGGRVTDVVHSNATVARSWEWFRVFCTI